MQKFALIIAGIGFAIISGIHWVRYYYQTEVMVGDTPVSLEMSMYMGIGSAVLALWMFIASRK